ncbi:MAG TPA: choice-of-anchor Q domain-containing protein [Acidobacteriota bacterium]|nr:choice-of-anchor Q domain-containing protein [Acidobacteriota bacterium]
MPRIIRPLCFLTAAFIALWAGPLEAAEFRVTMTADRNAGPCLPASCSLREAVLSANANPGPDEILLTSGRSYLLTLQGGGENQGLVGDLDITDSVTIRAEGTLPALISAEGLGDRVIDIRISDLQAAVIRLKRLVIQGGEAGSEEGGGIRVEALPGLSFPLVELKVSDSEVTRNVAGRGGGLAAVGASVMVSNSVFRDNEALAGCGLAEGCSGGAVSLRNPAGKVSQISSSSFLDNQAAEAGGAFALINASLDLRNATIHGNHAEIGGGAFELIATVTQVISLNHCTVVDNTSAGGGLAERGLPDNQSRVEFSNSLFFANSPRVCPGPRLVTLGGNLISPQCQSSHPDDVMSDQPRLGPLQNNDSIEGAALTMALMPGSPAIDQAQSSSCSRLDQRGGRRGIDGDPDRNTLGECDIGAYEAPPFQPATFTLSQPAAFQLADPVAGYRMVGSPLAGVGPASFLSRLIGQEPGPSTWLLFRYDTAQARYRPWAEDDPFFDFDPGRGFWLIVGGGLPSSSVEGIVNDASGAPYFLPLQRDAGWQQISSPFQFELEWGCIAQRLPPGASSQLLGFGPSGQAPEAVGLEPEASMRPARGYWFFLTQEHLEAQLFQGGFGPSDGDPFIEIPPLCGMLPAQSLMPKGRVARPSARPRGWLLRLSAVSGSLADDHNILGVDSAAEDGLDPLDQREAPSIHGLTLYFPQPEWSAQWPRFSADVRGLERRPSGFSGRQWMFEVRTPPSAQSVELSWSLSGLAPERLLLWDEFAGRWSDMLELNRYSFAAGPQNPRRFWVFQPAPAAPRR